MQIEDLINWTVLSKILSGSDNTIRKGKYSKKYDVRIDYLIQLLEIWKRDEDVWTKKEVQEWLKKLNFPE